MVKTILLCVAGLFGACSGYGTNIVLNPGFETGNLMSWTTDGNGSWIVATSANGIVGPHSGTFFADSHCSSSGCINTPDSFLFQDLPTTINQTYTLTFWYDRGISGPVKGGSSEELLVLWNGTPALDVAQLNQGGSDPGWTQFTVTGLTASSTSTRLEFRGRQDGASLGVDDVNVQASSAVPEPASLTLAGSALFGIGLFAMRKKELARCQACPDRHRISLRCQKHASPGCKVLGQ
jgi:hypothetical protein